MNIISIRNVEKVYFRGTQSVEILKNITIDIKKGEFVSLIGPSGSGKSTLLYLLYGIEPATSGEICINGKKLNAMTDRELSQIRINDIGFIYQFYNLLPTYTIEDNVLMPLMIAGQNTNQYLKKLDEILNYVGLYSKKKNKPYELSGGQQQRVAIARALITNPPIILADEPTGNLDSETGENIMKLLKKINNERNTTIVQVTHSQKQTEYGDKVVKIVDGRIMENCVSKNK